MTKFIIVSLTAFIFSLFCSVALADRITITGKPVLLDIHPGFFTFPSTYTDILMGYNSKGYYFVTIANVNRVCYLAKKPELEKIDQIKIVIEKSGLKLPWNCYKYDAQFFDANF